MLDVPGIPAEPATGGDNAVLADGPAVSALTFPLRVGQELVQAALNTVTGTDPVSTFTPWLGAWVLLIPGGAVAAASLLGSRRVVGLAAGVVVAGSAVLLQQVYNQNAGSVLGIALAPVVLACVVASLGRPPRVPLLLAGLMLAALVGTYTEYAPFVGPVLVGATLLRRTDRLHAVQRAVGVVAVAVAVAPLAWLRAVQTLIGVRGGAADRLGSPFLDVGPLVVLNRLVGVGPTTGGLEPSVVGLGLGVLVVVGLLLALALGPRRGMWIGLLAVGLPFLVVLSVQGLGYTQRRAIEIAFPLALFVAVLGWGSAIDRVLGSSRIEERVQRLGAGLRRALPVAAVVVLCLPLLAWAAVNAWSSLHAWNRDDLPARHVDGTFAEAEAWVRDVGGAHGADVSVLVPSFFEQQWLTMGLRDVGAVEYPAVRPDYFRAQSFWSGGVDRYWLVGEGVQVDADAGVVVESNARFRLLDLSRGDAVLAAPYSLTQWNTAVRPDGGFTTTGDAEVLVVRTSGAGDAVELTLRAESKAPVDVVITVADDWLADVDDLTTDPADLEVALPEGDDAVVLGLDATVGKDASAQNWVEMTGVRRVP
jgi:hypothetical protein